MKRLSVMMADIKKDGNAINQRLYRYFNNLSLQQWGKIEEVLKADKFILTNNSYKNAPAFVLWASYKLHKDPMIHAYPALLNQLGWFYRGDDFSFIEKYVQNGLLFWGRHKDSDVTESDIPYFYTLKAESKNDEEYEADKNKTQNEGENNDNSLLPLTEDVLEEIKKGATSINQRLYDYFKMISSEQWREIEKTLLEHKNNFLNHPYLNASAFVLWAAYYLHQHSKCQSYLFLFNQLGWDYREDDLSDIENYVKEGFKFWGRAKDNDIIDKRMPYFHTLKAESKNEEEYQADKIKAQNEGETPENKNISGSHDDGHDVQKISEDLKYPSQIENAEEEALTFTIKNRAIDHKVLRKLNAEGTPLYKYFHDLDKGEIAIIEEELIEKLPSIMAEKPGDSSIDGEIAALFTLWGAYWLHHDKPLGKALCYETLFQVLNIRYESKNLHKVEKIIETGLEFFGLKVACYGEEKQYLYSLAREAGFCFHDLEGSTSLRDFFEALLKGYGDGSISYDFKILSEPSYDYMENLIIRKINEHHLIKTYEANCDLFYQFIKNMYHWQQKAFYEITASKKEENTESQDAITVQDVDDWLVQQDLKFDSAILAYFIKKGIKIPHILTKRQKQEAAITRVLSYRYREEGKYLRPHCCIKHQGIFPKDYFKGNFGNNVKTLYIDFDIDNVNAHLSRLSAGWEILLDQRKDKLLDLSLLEGLIGNIYQTDDEDDKPTIKAQPFLAPYEGGVLFWEKSDKDGETSFILTERGVTKRASIFVLTETEDEPQKKEGNLEITKEEALEDDGYQFYLWQVKGCGTLEVDGQKYPIKTEAKDEYVSMQIILNGERVEEIKETDKKTLKGWSAKRHGEIFIGPIKEILFSYNNEPPFKVTDKENKEGFRVRRKKGRHFQKTFFVEKNGERLKSLKIHELPKTVDINLWEDEDNPGTASCTIKGFPGDMPVELVTGHKIVPLKREGDYFKGEIKAEVAKPAEISLVIRDDKASQTLILTHAWPHKSPFFTRGETRLEGDISIKDLSNIRVESPLQEKLSLHISLHKGEGEAAIAFNIAQKKRVLDAYFISSLLPYMRQDGFISLYLEMKDGDKSYKSEVLTINPLWDSLPFYQDDDDRYKEWRDVWEERFQKEGRLKWQDYHQEILNAANAIEDEDATQEQKALLAALTGNYKILWYLLFVSEEENLNKIINLVKIIPLFWPSSYCGDAAQALSKAFEDDDRFKNLSLPEGGAEDLRKTVEEACKKGLYEHCLLLMSKIPACREHLYFALLHCPYSKEKVEEQINSDVFKEAQASNKSNNDDDVVKPLHRFMFQPYRGPGDEKKMADYFYICCKDFVINLKKLPSFNQSWGEGIEIEPLEISQSEQNLIVYPRKRQIAGHEYFFEAPYMAAFIATKYVGCGAEKLADLPLKERLQIDLLLSIYRYYYGDCGKVASFDELTAYIILFMICHQLIKKNEKDA